MKKVRIEPKQGQTCKVRLFESPEAAYVWMNAKEEERVDIGNDVVADADLCECIEIEWMGCEYVYDPDLKNGHERFEFLHLVKITPTGPTADLKDALVSLYEGWSMRQYVQFCASETAESKVLPIDDIAVKSKVNIGKLFEKLHESSTDEPER